jgi:hypothetical protein
VGRAETEAVEDFETNMELDEHTVGVRVGKADLEAESSEEKVADEVGENFEAVPDEVKLVKDVRVCVERPEREPLALGDAERVEACERVTLGDPEARAEALLESEALAQPVDEALCDATDESETQIVKVSVG